MRHLVDALGHLHHSAGLNVCDGGEHAATVWIQNRTVYLTTFGGCQRADQVTRVSMSAQNLTFTDCFLCVPCVFHQSSKLGKLSTHALLVYQQVGAVLQSMLMRSCLVPAGGP